MEQRLQKIIAQAGLASRRAAEKARESAAAPKASAQGPGVYRTKLGDKAPKGMTINAKTGELKWTPGDDTEIGETIVPLILTDNDVPPQTSTLNLKLDAN